MFAFVGIVRFNVDIQADMPAGCGRQFVVQAGQIARDQGKQVAGFWVGVMPDSIVAGMTCAIGFGVPGLLRVAVRQQHRVFHPVGQYGDCVDGQYVRAVREKGDLPKALGLALGAEVSSGLIQAHQRGIAGRADSDDRGNLAFIWSILDSQVGVCQLIPGFVQWLTVQRDGLQHQLLAVQF